jgi:predicted MFS family arabinose efflux permease
MVMDIAGPEERTHAFSVQTALLALAAFSGALIGGFLPRIFAGVMGMTLQQPGPYRLPLIFAAALMAPAVWAILSIRHTPASEDAGPVSAGTRPASRRGAAESSLIVTLVLLSVVRFFQVGGIGSASTFFNVYMDTELSVATGQIGVLAAVARLMGVPAALLTPVLVARWGAPRSVLGASLLTAISMVPLALIPHWGAAGLGYVGVTALSSIRYPAFLLYSMELVPPNWRGTLAGAGEMAGGLSFALMAFVGGYMIEAQGFTALFLTGAVLATVGTLLFYLWFMLPRAKRVALPTT